jgi:hypothetical protein
MDTPVDVVPETEQPPKKKLSGWVIALIVLGVVIVCACLIVLLIPVVLALLGPSVGNVFSNVINNLGTPTP